MSLSAVEQAAASGLQQAMAHLTIEQFTIGSKTFRGHWNGGAAGFRLEGPGGKHVTLVGSIIAKRSEFTDWQPLAWTAFRRGGVRYLITEVVMNEVFCLVTVGSET